MLFSLRGATSRGQPEEQRFPSIGKNTVRAPVCKQPLRVVSSLNEDPAGHSRCAGLKALSRDFPAGPVANSPFNAEGLGSAPGGVLDPRATTKSLQIEILRSPRPQMQGVGKN